MITLKSGRKHLTVSTGPNECRSSIRLYKLARKKTDQQTVHGLVLKYKHTKGREDV